jgi:hypothetical protein
MILSMQGAPPASPNAYVHIQPNGKIVIMVRHLEMRQGVTSWSAHYRTAPQTLLGPFGHGGLSRQSSIGITRREP